MKYTLIENLYEEDRKVALADHLGVSPEDIKTNGENEFSVTVDGEERDYLVLTEDEAYDLEKEYIKNLLDDMGPAELFGKHWTGWKDYIDDNWFEESFREHYTYYTEDIESCNDDKFENRLISEMYDEGILTDEDFEENEDGEVDYKKLKDEIDIDDKKEEFIDKITNDIPDYIDEFIFHYGDKEFDEAVKNNSLMDEDGLAEKCIELDGVGHNIAGYDGKEIELGGGLFAYRTN